MWGKKHLIEMKSLIIHLHLGPYYIRAWFGHIVDIQISQQIPIFVLCLFGEMSRFLLMMFSEWFGFVGLF